MIRKTASGKWAARYGHGGPLRTFDRKADAETYVAEQRRDAQTSRAGLEVVKGPLRYRDLVSLYNASFQPSPWTLKMIDYSKARFGKHFVRSIEAETVGAWLHGLELSEKSKRHVLTAMRQVLNAGIEWGYLQKSPARRGLFKIPSDRRVRPILPFESWDEVVAVSEACAEGMEITGPLVRFLCATGLRTPGEWINAQWKDVHGNEMVVHGTKTSAAARTIPLSVQAVSALAELPRSLDGRIFFGIRGGAFDYPNWRRGDWRRALTACGLEHRSPYECRHTFATLALQAGVPIDDVSSIMGHTDVAMTFRYYRKWTRPMLDRARNILDTITEATDDNRIDAVR